MSEGRERLERIQPAVYGAAVALGALAAAAVPGADRLRTLVEPALALMLFATFLQVPLAAIGRALGDVRLPAALLVSNFVAVPALVALLVPLLPDDPVLRLGATLVLLAPCIDYVVTFAHLGRADARALLAATLLLLAAQLLLVPPLLRLLLDDPAAEALEAGALVRAFAVLIAVPFALAALVQTAAARSPRVRAAAAGLGLLPVPATALVLALVTASVLPVLGPRAAEAARLVPVYVLFAAAAPAVGWGVGRAAGLDPPGARAVAFSTATRNSLVVLPLAAAVPGGAPLLAAAIVTQTLVELCAEVVYVRLIPRLGRRRAGG